jgi:hypothetical protein
MLQSSSLLRWIIYTHIWSSDSFGRAAQKLHEDDLDKVEEDGIFFEENLMFHFFNSLWFPLPSLIKYTAQSHKLPLKAQDHMMMLHKRTLQKVQFMRRKVLPDDKKDSPLFFVGKECCSWHKLANYQAWYPDARYLSIARAPKDSLASFFQLLNASIGSKTGIDMKGQKKFFDSLMIQKRIDCQIQV